MATSVGTPVIGLYATTNPMRARPYLSADWVVNRYPEALEAEYGLTVERAPWGKRVRNPRAMERVTVADVTEKLDRLMSVVHGPASSGR
jgi:heptosyltransferase I